MFRPIATRLQIITVLSTFFLQKISPAFFFRDSLMVKNLLLRSGYFVGKKLRTKKIVEIDE
jgi:hypothetical protein